MRKPIRPRQPRSSGAMPDKPRERFQGGPKPRNPPHAAGANSPTQQRQSPMVRYQRTQEGESFTAPGGEDRHSKNQDLVFGVEPIRELIAAAP